MSRVREILKDCQIYSNGLNITGEKTEEIISALEKEEKRFKLIDINNEEKNLS